MIASALQLEEWLDALFADAPATFLAEVRYITTDDGDRAGQCWVPCNRRGPLAELVRGLGKRTDTFVSVVPRRHRHAGRDALGCSPAACVALPAGPVDTTAPPPSFTICDRVRPIAYWLLESGTPLQVAEHLSVLLARRLGHGCVALDGNHFARAPDTYDHGGEPQPVTATGDLRTRYVATELASKLHERTAA